MAEPVNLCPECGHDNCPGSGNYVGMREAATDREVVLISQPGRVLGLAFPTADARVILQHLNQPVSG